MEMRKYQKECVRAMFDSMHAQVSCGLVALPTGAGKTIIFSKFIEEIYRRYSGKRRRIRACILAHREKLVTQAMEKLLKVWPESAPRIGMACASSGMDVNIGSEIVIGSIQTISSRIRSGSLEPFDIVLVDEGHRIPWREQKSLYCDFLNLTEKLSPKRKVFAFTATPYRLGHGYIYGNRCKAGRTNWFSEMTYSVNMDDLIRDGYLVPYTIRQAVDIGPELRSVPIVNGEYKNDILGTVMCRFADSAAEAWLAHGEGRKRNVAFCANIDHSEKVAEAFRKRGISAAAVHSQMPDDERRRRLDAFSRGEIRLLSSVDVLVEGWDETAIDCIMMLRPTKAPMIYVQQAGRGLRLHEGKKDLLILDLADNARTHGFPSSPEVVVPGEGKGGEAPVKICPECLLALHASIMTCPECGHVFPRKEYREPDAIHFEDVSPESCAYTREKPTRAKIRGVDIDGDQDRIKICFNFRDPLKGKMRKAWWWINANRLSWPSFAREWKFLTNLDVPPKDMDEAFDIVNRYYSEDLWPDYGYFYKKQARSGLWDTLCGWDAEGWEKSYFPEGKKPQEASGPDFARQQDDLPQAPGTPVTERRKAVPERPFGVKASKKFLDAIAPGIQG